ncbi:MAG: hypothetical protein J6K14_07930 [Clostridia bacterium]|nr:hypothetical protein [Clostridia bacterium]
MEINVLPKKYKNNNGYMISCLMTGTLAEKDEKIAALETQKKPLWDMDFGDYIKTVCIKQWVKVGIWGGILLGIIGAIAVALAVPFDDMEWYIAAICFSIPMALGVIACFLLGPRAVYGFVLAIVLAPIFYPIYMSICTSHNRKIFKHNDEIDAKINLLNEECKEELKKIAETRARMFSEYEEAFEKEMQKQVEKMADNSAVREIAEWLAKRFIGVIKEADRAPHIKDIASSLEYVVSKRNVTSATEKYTFAEHLCKDLDSELMQAALSKAVALRIQKCIKEHYETDEIETIYKIQVETFDNLKDKKASADKSELLLRTVLTYKAENPNYKPAQSW